jgi:hypothetical protein
MNVETEMIVLAAIADNEESIPGEFSCDNSVIDEATGLNPLVVDEALENLWRAGEIEGADHRGGNRCLAGRAAYHLPIDHFRPGSR